MEGELCFPHLNTSCWKPKRPPSHTVLIYIVLSFISLLTVTLNLLVIVSISHFRQLHTSTNFLLLSLAVSDFLVGLIILFEGMLIDGCWFFSDLMCTLYYFVEYIATSSSIGTMVLISIDRYVAICDPLRYPTKVTQRRVRILISLGWVCSCTYVSFLFGAQIQNQPGGFKSSCAGECVIVFNIIERVIDLILTFITPITIIIVLYIRVFVVVVSQARAMRSHVVVVSHQRFVKRSELKAARTLGVVIIVFLSCICPFFCVSLTGQDTVFNVSSAAVVTFLAYCNSCLNPLIYAFFYPWFRKSIRLIATLQILNPGSREVQVLKS